MYSVSIASLTSLAMGFTATRTFFARVFDVVTGTIFATLKWNGGTGGVDEPTMPTSGPLPPSTASRIAPPTSTTATAPPTIARRRTTFDRWVGFLARPG